MKSIAKVLIAPLAIVSLAICGTETHRQFTENALKGAVTLDKPNNRAVVGKGAQMTIFNVQQSRTPTSITITATQTSGVGQGRVASLNYNIPTETIIVA